LTPGPGPFFIAIVDRTRGKDLSIPEMKPHRDFDILVFDVEMNTYDVDIVVDYVITRTLS
jgi:hypothetical protein